MPGSVFRNGASTANVCLASSLVGETMHAPTWQAHAPQPALSLTHARTHARSCLPGAASEALKAL